MAEGMVEVGAMGTAEAKAVMMGKEEERARQAEAVMAAAENAWAATRVEA